MASPAASDGGAERRLNREWYGMEVDGNLAGDEENNPFAQYEDTFGDTVASIAAKHQKRMTGEHCAGAE
ncbi:hypothetical protein V8E36_007365 [Tilletia maclaganii]